MSLFRSCLLCAFLLLLMLPCASAFRPFVNDEDIGAEQRLCVWIKRDKERQRGYVLREKAIKEELAALPNHSWAGEYEGFFSILHLSPKAGAAVGFLSGCVSWSVDHGDVAEGGQRLRIVWTSRPDEVSVARPSELLLIRWRGRRYLIPTVEILEFCLDVQQKKEPRYKEDGFWWLRKGDHKLPAPGLPDLPKGFERYLSMGPIRASVISFGPEIRKPSVDVEGVERTTRKAVLSVGSAGGILPGMRFRFADSKEDEGIRITVTQVRQDEAEGVLSYVQETDKLKTSPVVGSRFVSP